MEGPALRLARTCALIPGSPSLNPATAGGSSSPPLAPRTLTPPLVPHASSPRPPTKRQTPRPPPPTAQAIELSAEVLANVKFIKEKKLISCYFEQISQDTGRYCFGVVDTIKALEMGAVETVSARGRRRR